MSWIGEWVQEKAASYLKSGVQAGGTLAGNAVGSVGSLVEDSGRSFGQGVTGGINSVGDYINGYGNSIKSSLSADGPVNDVQKRTSMKGTAVGSKPASPKSTVPGTSPRAITSTKYKGDPKGKPNSVALPPNSRAESRGNASVSGQPARKQRPLGTQGGAPVPAVQGARPPGAAAKASSAEKSKSSLDVGKGMNGSNARARTRTPVSRTPVSTRQSRTRPDGKVIISAESRPRPARG